MLQTNLSSYFKLISASLMLKACQTKDLNSPQTKKNWSNLALRTTRDDHFVNWKYISREINFINTIIEWELCNDYLGQSCILQL